MEDSGFLGPLWARRCLATVLLGLLPLGTKSQPSLGTCSFPPMIDNAEMKNKFKSLTYFPRGLVIEYNCIYGTDKIPGTSITCQKNLRWTEPQEICKAPTCPDPGHPKNELVQARQKEYTVGSTVTFFCAPGYKLVGPGTSVCVRRGKDVEWSNVIPTCKKLFCPPPPDIANGSHNDTGNPHAYGAVITYHCIKPFSIVGSDSLSCNLKGNDEVEWKGKLPVCKVIDCENPVIEHGIISDGLGPTYRYGDNVTIECNIGYFMVGSYWSHCEENRTWYPNLPFCKEIDPSICGTPFIQRGTVHPLQSYYTIGTIISVICNPDYSFLDETIEMSSVCEGYNLWTPPVQPCLFRTSPDSCELTISHGNIIQGKKNNYIPGDTVTIRCSAGYTLVGPSEIRYIGGKRWLPRIPSCSLSFVFTFLIVACLLVLLFWPARFLYMKCCSP